jgi:hypothetical protein
VTLTRDDHFGLVGIQERASGIGGVFEIYSAGQSGTLIRVSVPDEESDAAAAPELTADWNEVTGQANQSEGMNRFDPEKSYDERNDQGYSG